MNPSRPVPWVSPVLYTAVLIAGLYAGIAGLGDTHTILFVAGLAALFGLEYLALPRVPALLGRVALFVLVSAADGSGVSRALFVLVPFTAYFAFGRTVSIVLGLACVAGVIGVFTLTVPGWDSDLERVSDLLMFTLGIVLAIAMASVAVEEARSRERVAHLSAVAERNRVARDIHDDLGHHLTAVVVLLEKASAFRDRDPGAADKALDDASRSARRALADVRHSVQALHSEPFRLSVALAELVAGSVPVRVDGDEGRYGEPVLRVLYRAAQEGITNARRHASASEITALVELGEDEARVTVADNGCGFEPGREGFGLRAMRERVTLVGGRVDLLSVACTGTKLSVVVPRKASS